MQTYNSNLQSASVAEELERMAAVKEKAEALVEEYSNRINELEKVNRELEFQAKKSKQEIEAMQSYTTRVSPYVVNREINTLTVLLAQ